MSTSYEQCCILWIFPCGRVYILFLWSSHMTFSHLKGNKYTTSGSHSCSYFPFHLVIHLPGELKRKHFTDVWRYNLQTTGIELDTVDTGESSMRLELIGRLQFASYPVNFKKKESQKVIFLPVSAPNPESVSRKLITFLLSTNRKVSPGGSIGSSALDSTHFWENT